MPDKFTFTDFCKFLTMVAEGGHWTKMSENGSRGNPTRSVFATLDSTQVKTVLGIVDAMTPAERADSVVVDHSGRDELLRAPVAPRRRSAGCCGCTMEWPEN